MFAYTGLTPQQMEKLAKEVGSPGNHSMIPLTDILVFRVRDQGRQDIGCRHHFRQRQAPCRVHSQDHPVIDFQSALRKNRHEHCYP